MATLLLLLDTPSDAALLRSALESAAYRIAAEITDPAHLNAEVVRHAPDVLIACTHSPSREMIESLRTLTAASPRPILMFARDTSRDTIRAAVEAGVSAYVVDGWAPSRITAIVEAACARFDAYESVKRELRATQHKLAERKLVEKAKGLVMQQRGMSEELAYSSLRKMAMDQNLTLAEVARRVIAVAHLLA
jgi:response regulator NasT